jgi:hypothetical protein
MSDWRALQADALEAQADTINAALVQLAVVEAVLERRAARDLLGELRAFCAGLRCEVDELEDEAAQLRNAAPTPTRKEPVA